MAVSGLEVWNWWREARQQAISADIPVDEVDWLLQALSGLSRLELRLGSFQQSADLALDLPLDEIAQRWQQRLHERVPVQYLAGQAAWREFSLVVSPAVLIPRPETELLIELAQSVLSSSLSSPLFLSDLGTGSGAIALGLATTFPTAMVHAVDASLAALDVARLNAAAYQLSDRIVFHSGSWFEPLGALKGQLAAMISNPPYIPSPVVAELQPEVRDHEPRLALDGGADGLEAIRHLVQTAPDYLQPGGLWLVELMAGQAGRVANLLHQNGHYHRIQIHKDLAGIDRFALAQRI